MSKLCWKLQSTVQLDERCDRAFTVEEAYNGVGVGILLSEFAGISSNLNVSITVGVVEEICGGLPIIKNVNTTKSSKLGKAK